MPRPIFILAVTLFFGANAQAAITPFQCAREMEKNYMEQLTDLQNQRKAEKKEQRREQEYRANLELIASVYQVNMHFCDSLASAK